VRPVYDRPRRGKDAYATDEAPVLKSLREACDVASVRTLLELYPGLVATNALHRNDTRRIAQALHARVRNMRDADVSLDDIFIFVQRMVSDIQAGALPPHPYAHVHLLGVYKECERYQEGYAFWQWLVDKDTMHVTQAVYGAALELAAYGNILPLDEIEDLYADALKRFPGVFAEYHLSPEAIVPDRSQPVAMTNVPMLLLQGILTARILAGDWRNAYLALDTALRLFPAQVPTRYFELFVTNRPLPEAYTAFLVACRAGVLFKPSHLTVLIKQLRMGLVTASLPERVMALRAIANAIYAYLEAGGSLQAPHVGAFIRVFETVVPTTTGGQELSADGIKLRNTIITAAHEFASTLIQAGLPPHIHIFTALIHLAGKFQVPSLLQACLQDIQSAQLVLQPVDLRTILYAAGWLGDKDLIQQYWTRIASDAETKGERLEYDDWVTLAKACSRHGYTDYFKEQLWEYEHTLSAALKLRLTFHTESAQPRIRQLDSNMELAAFTTEIDALRSQVQDIAAVVMSGQPLDLGKTPFYMSLDPKRPPLGLPHDLRTVYDEHTTDPHQPAPPSGTITPSLSPTGIPLDELRFQNWVSVLEMMSYAKANVSVNKNAPFGGDVPDGLPLKLDTLRETILDLRKSAPSLRKVAHEFKTEKAQYRSMPKPSEDFGVVDPSAADSPEMEYENPRLRRISTDDKEGQIRRVSTGQAPSTPSGSLVKRVFIGEGFTKRPALNYHGSHETEHDARDATVPKRKIWKAKKTKNTLGILRGAEVDRRAKAARSDGEGSGQAGPTQDANNSAS
jgi:hypothetical protein